MLHKSEDSTDMYAYNILCILNTIQKNALEPKPRNAQPRFTAAQLLLFFLQLLPHRALRQLPALKNKTFYDRLFTPLVTLWYLLFQRLHHDHSLDAALADAQAGGADRLNRRLSRGLVSCSTASYSDARQRLPGEFLVEALRLQGRKLTRLSPTALWQGLVVALLDGSTVRLRPDRNIPKEFPPHGNQHPNGTYWCLMRVVVSFCGFTGAALDCTLGSTHLSEQALGGEIILRALGRCLFIGDRNFGVFRLVQAARAKQHHVLLRLTDVRAAKLLGHALRLGDHALTWKPTRHDQVQPGLSKDPLAGRLMVVQLQRSGFRAQRLCLFTTLDDVAQYPMGENGQALWAALAHRTGPALRESPDGLRATRGPFHRDGAQGMDGHPAGLQLNSSRHALRRTAQRDRTARLVLLGLPQTLGILAARFRPHQSRCPGHLAENTHRD